jgi:phage shock protein PspC (stress-responsive transcriptional regulator)
MITEHDSPGSSGGEPPGDDLGPPRPARPRVPGRSTTDRPLSGVAGGIAAALGVPSPYVRAAFVVLTFAGGIGIVVYLVAWLVGRDEEPPQPAPAVPERRRLALALIYLGSLLALRAVGLWFGDDVVWPIALVSFGTAAVWDRREPTPGTTAQDIFFTPSRSRLAAGALLMVVGVSAFFSSVDAFDALGPVVVAVSITLLGSLFVFGPWVWRMAGELAAERRDRIRTEERADMAAHLHDSVLQTLALIQRTDDPRRMVTLARAQERELRSWLYGTEDGAANLAGALEQTAARVEQAHDVPVEVVTVGDRSLDDDLRALVAAAGEAMTNAAKHASATRISVYAEITETAADVWVSDQGTGFDLAAVDRDRRGISESIEHRMERHGGSAEIISEPGEGTEVHLTMRTTNGNQGGVR